MLIQHDEKARPVAVDRFPQTRIVSDLSILRDHLRAGADRPTRSCHTFQYSRRGGCPGLPFSRTGIGIRARMPAGLLEIARIINVNSDGLGWFNEADVLDLDRRSV